MQSFERRNDCLSVFPSGSQVSGSIPVVASVLRLQGRRAPHVTLSTQRRWHLVSVGSVWDSASSTLITDQLDKTAGKPEGPGKSMGF